MTHPYLADDQPLAFAHRGAHGVATGAGENSYEAFAAAVDLGYRYLETDVHCTADGVVVALHDETLDRTTDGEGLVVQRAWGEIQRLTVEGGGRVPRLDELLADFPEARFNLDCKDPDTVPELVRVLREADAMQLHGGDVTRGATAGRGGGRAAGEPAGPDLRDQRRLRAGAAP